MKIYNNINSVDKKFHNAVLAIGNFDGVHLGHQELLRKAYIFSRKINKKFGIFTFDPLPKDFFNRTDNKILNISDKIDIVKKFRADFFIKQNFNRNFSKISHDNFAKIILLKKLAGTIQNDILKEYAARGTYIYPPKHSMRIITDIFEYCGQHLPKWNSISISGYHIREAGSTAVQEVAFTLSNGKAYVKAAIEKGLDINVFGKRLSFFFNAHNNLFEEVAKFRAARKMWATIMKDLGATDEKALMLRFHTQTGGATLTAQQPLNNISRVTIQTIAAVLGGTQSLHTNGFDEALGLPTQEAASIALRTQQIVANESGITDTADPLAGSYFVESLTNELEEKALALIQQIDEMGGAVSSIENGFMQNKIAESAYAYQKAIESKEKIIVGVNQFESTSTTNIPVFQIDESIRIQQIEKLIALKSSRDSIKMTACLAAVKAAASGTENIMPSVIEAIENYCTLGEIADILRGIYGEYQA